MTTLVTRAGKGTALSWSEVDTNFTNLSDDIAALDTAKLSVTTAASTYETQTHAASTYAPITTTVTKDSSTGAVNTTNGTTAERPSSAVAKIRYNSTLDSYEGYTTFYGWDGLHNGSTLKLGRNANNIYNLKITSGGGSDVCVITNGADTAIATLRQTVNEFAGAIQVNGLSQNVYPRMPIASSSVGTGTTFEIATIPSWATRITILFHDISSSSTGNAQIQVANSGTYITTGYVGAISQVTAAAVNSGALSGGFNLTLTSTSSSIFSGRVTLERQAIAGDYWIASGDIGYTSGINICHVAGHLNVGTLDKVRLNLTTGNFDGGFVYGWYE